MNRCKICGEPCKRLHNIFCSYKCSGMNRRTRITRNCAKCGTTFQAPRFEVLKGKGRYCSKTCSNQGQKRPLVDRFWSHVKKTSTCWTWTGGIHHTGYGVIQSEYGRRQLRAPRVSYEIHFGSIPKGKWVLHRCDNRSCVNPKHLFIGTVADNNLDKLTKGRQPKGAKHPRAKLTETDVRSIRQFLSLGERRSAIAKRFGVSYFAIQDIDLGRNWKHVN